MGASRCEDVVDSWMTRYRRPLVGFVLPYVNGDVQAAEDVVQETMLRGWQILCKGSCHTFRLDQSPGQVHGNNFSDSFGGTSFTWQVVAASGTASSSTQPASPGGGYSYPATGPYGN